MKSLLVGAAMMMAGTVSTAAQALSIEAYGVAATDRRSGVVDEGPARGLGGGGALTGVLGSVEAELRVYAARLSIDSSSERRDVLQAEVRGFISAGIQAQIPVNTWGRFWGRLAYIPHASLSGGGETGFGAEAALGIECALVGRIRLIGRYEFQRIDRKITPPTGGDDRVSVPVELDVAQIGISVRLGT